MTAVLPNVDRASLGSDMPADLYSYVSYPWGTWPRQVPLASARRMGMDAAMMQIAASAFPQINNGTLAAKAISQLWVL